MGTHIIRICTIGIGIDRRRTIGEYLGVELVGIARLAAESELLEAKKRVEYLELETRRFLGKNAAARWAHVWSLNPYRGCEFGCKYCYARYAHEFMELRDPLEFERKIFAKRFDAGAFRGELRRVKPGESIWIGTATDPYQPAEKRFEVTRRILEVLAGERGRRVSVTTKSTLVQRDLDLLGEVHGRNRLRINVTVTTLDADLARALEPMAPRPDLRMEAVRALAGAGLRVSVFAHPVMPLINDGEAGLEAVCAAAAAAGAEDFSASALYLKPSAARVFFPFLEERYPHLVRRYRERYEASPYLKGHYPEILRARVTGIQTRHGMAHGGEQYHPDDCSGQLPLFS